jgi:hypothetical protein
MYATFIYRGHVYHFMGLDLGSTHYIYVSYLFFFIFIQQNKCIFVFYDNDQNYYF